MGMYWRRFTIRLLLPISWKLSKKRASHILQRFSTTEADGAWQFLYALDAVEDPAHRANLFGNALEEVCHASKFEKAAIEYSNVPPLYPRMIRKPLYESKKGLFEFLAHIYVGEKAVYEQFGAYMAAIGKNGGMQSVFDEAQEDEDGHVDLAKQVLINLGGTEESIKKSVFKIKIKRAYESWLRASKAMGEVTSAILLSVIYYVFGALFVTTCRKRLARSALYETQASASETNLLSKHA